MPTGLNAHLIKVIGSKKARATTNKGKGPNPRKKTFCGVPLNRNTIRIGLLNHNPFASDEKHESNNSDNDQYDNDNSQAISTCRKSIKLGGKPVKFIV